ncbi:MAG: helix-turn-helix domain-containing protein [Lachnospiraceae bacterium]|nr:helix-turn-helix domain-containing protein [Lachnospiraceae bacterium]
MSSVNSMDIFRKNLANLIQQDPHTSMRNLSTSIGASDSYIRKILAEGASPSFDKIDAISEFFNINSWELFYDADNDDNDSLATIQLLNRMPKDMLPVVQSYLDYLLNRQEP